MCSYYVVGIILSFLTCTNICNNQNKHKKYYFNLHFVDEGKKAQRGLVQSHINNRW